MFKWKILFLLAMALAPSPAASKEKCSDVQQAQQAEEPCSDTVYESYVECMHQRSKRSLDCYDEDDCASCDCSSCEYGGCGDCASCCPYDRQIDSCRSRSCCHSTCNSSCRNSSCRKRCRSACKERVVAVHDTPSSSSSRFDTKHNITTVINLHNLINNTNIIDMPITINNTNVNNITVDNQGSVSGGCCKIIGPRQCVPTPNYPFSKCFHMRKNHCGSICTNSIMHAEPHQVCEQSDGQNHCEQLVSFIPQPKPSCSYTSSYPYVSCSVNEHSCVGCYNHMFNGGSPPSQCTSSCYDKSLSVGPMGNYNRLPMNAYNDMFRMGGVEGSDGLGGMGSMGGYGNPEEFGMQVMGMQGNQTRRSADPGIGELMKELQEPPKGFEDKVHEE